MGAAVLGGGLAADALERADEVALVVEAAGVRDLREEHAGGGEQLDGRIHADRGDVARRGDVQDGAEATAEMRDGEAGFLSQRLERERLRVVLVDERDDPLQAPVPVRQRVARRHRTPHARRSDDCAVRVLQRVDARDDESQFPLYVNLLVIILR